MTGYRSGAPTRRAILLALLESEPRTVRGLATELSVDYRTALHHVGMMERAGLLSVERGRGQHGSAVRLTDAGRLAALS